MSGPGDEGRLPMPWTGSTAERLGDVRVNTPTRPRARVIDRTVERPRSVEAPGRNEEEYVPRTRMEGLNRFFNVVLAAIGLALTLPILIIVALLIKATSRGPILYTQTRVGLDRRWRRTLALRESRQEDLGGQVFTIYKLRTMRVDAEKVSGAVWATENDPRVTTLGKYLRKYRIDEVPQLWNVLLGDMNIVGPRPERPSIVARLRHDIPEYRYRHRVKPGLTGLAQINQKYDACLDDVRAKVSWDLRYIREQSLWLDIRVMLQTVPSVLLKFQGW
ncbi:MAG: sugar transferase [Gemmatimonadetes bacterium]|nr:sugar transferase [Gemmatimonadota bacterium]